MSALRKTCFPNANTFCGNTMKAAITEFQQQQIVLLYISPCVGHNLPWCVIGNVASSCVTWGILTSAGLNCVPVLVTWFSYLFLLLRNCNSKLSHAVILWVFIFYFYRKNTCHVCNCVHIIPLPSLTNTFTTGNSNSRAITYASFFTQNRAREIAYILCTPWRLVELDCFSRVPVQSHLWKHPYFWYVAAH